MDAAIGDALASFEKHIAAIRDQLRDYSSVSDYLFRDTEEWRDLLTYKLVPHLAGQGCLVVAVAGGTNTGKSTVFNLLAGKEVSPVLNTAAATCHPVVAANEHRRAQCLESKLVPEFNPLPLEDPAGPTIRDAPAEALYVALVSSLPDHLIVMDTPDIDSIDKVNWEVAEHIRAAGDVLVAVITGDKYKDDRVVNYFREAVSSGRMVVPLLNKANPANDFEVARRQLSDFDEDVGIEGEGFVVEHDFNVGDDLSRPIRSLGGDTDLRSYLEGLDVRSIKERVFRETVLHFARKSGDFLDASEDFAVKLERVISDLDGRARTFAEEFDPLPGEAVGGLFHAFVQSKRGPIRRAIGSTSSAFVRGANALGRSITRGFRKRTTLENEAGVSVERISDAYRRSVERIVRDMCSAHIADARSVEAPLKELFIPPAEEIDVPSALSAVLEDTFRSDNVSDEFREHAQRMLELWWEDHKGKRRVLESLDIMLAVMPAAIAAPIAMHTGGIGASEAAVAIGPFAAQFVTRVMEYQFGDAMFDFLSPWKKEQQETLERSLRSHISEPCLKRAREMLNIVRGESLRELRRLQDQCLRA